MSVGDPRVAVVGIACRLPHAPDPETFWRLLESGRYAVGEEIDCLDQFDPAFFGISPREASAMDSRQGLTLELVWEALEDARVLPDAIRGDRAGVFLGSIASDYSNPTHRSELVSSTLGLAGPSVEVDAVQSPSLLAVHRACESLCEGKADLALAGGVHLDVDPSGGVGGEGGGIVALKPLDAALAGGDRVRCVIRAGEAGDGAGKGLTVAELIEAILTIEHRLVDGSLDAGDGSRELWGGDCHLVLEGAPEGRNGQNDASEDGPAEMRGATEQPLPGPVPLALSAKSEPALRAAAGRLHSHLEANPDLDPADVAYSLATTRSHFGHRAVAVGRGRDDLLTALARFAQGGNPAGVARGTGDDSRGTALLFPGQGGQWAGMAGELLETSPAFARHMSACEEALEPFVEWSLRTVVRDRDGSHLDRLDVLQPALLMVMISLGKLWCELGSEPTVVVGHSQGEIAAAHIAGGLSLDDAARVGALHSRLSLPLVGRGGMLAVALSLDELSLELRPFGTRLSIAAINGPASVVVSGESSALTELSAACAEGGVRAQRIAVDYAAHSVHLEELRDDLIEAFSPISPRSGEILFHSTVTGDVLDIAELGPEYWYRNLRHTVRFETAISALLEQGWRTFTEIGPHPVLGFGVQETIDARRLEATTTVLCPMRREEGGPDRFALSLAEAHVAGAALDWEAFFSGAGVRPVSLPTYPFQHTEHRPGQGRLEPDQGGLDLMLDLVRTEVATLLGSEPADTVDAGRPFKELGFDSLTSMELRNRLSEATGLRLVATVAFDHPTPASLAAHLSRQVSGVDAPRDIPAVSAAADDEPIAIVGMACRYPGGVASPEDLWGLVAEGGDGISLFPPERGWDLERLYHPDPANAGTFYVREGGLLADAGDFDAEFFGIAPREAVAIDPQQRLLLEASWEALEGAGIEPAALSGERAGVFAGISSQDYTAGLRAPEEELEGYRLTGSLTSVASGRVSYALGLQGPAITVDTACSSSLVAMHLAAQALRSGECSLALAGGATVLGSPGMFVEFSRQRGLAVDGRCKSFAEAADGTAFSDGVGVLALQRLSDAEKHGHEILAVLKGSAVNQDGASNGLTAPNGPSQERVIRQALANARLEPKDIDAVEAHGTGTTLGDPIEAGALLATYGQDREEPLRLGSIKSNIGHTQAAAGVAGVIKMVEAMRHGVLPKTLHVDKPSSKVDWEAGEVELLTEEIPWQPNGKPRRAGVSSFGISGTNAHVIIEEAPEPELIEASDEQEAPEPPLRGTIALPLSAKTEPALREAAANLATHLSENPELDPEDIAFSLATTRALFERRGVVTGSDRDELLSGLTALSQGEPAPNVSEGKAQTGKLAYLLTGQGAQRATMGKELHEASPAFAKALDEACEAIDQHLGRPLKDLLFAKEGSKQAALLDQTTFTQPALFAIEAALFRLTEQLGMRPDYLTGHSVGEISAAHISGVLSLNDAAKLICTRAKLMGELPKGGAMVAIEATEQEVREAIEGKEKELSIAAVNGPTAIVISGVEKAALEVQADFEEQGKKTKRLAVSHAFHSPLIEPVLADFAKVAEALDYQAPQIPIVSNTSGELLTEEQATDPAYWVSHVREAVRFAEGIETLQEQGVTTFVELGPDAVLTAMATSCLPEGSEATLIPTLRKGRGEAESLVGALASAHAAGAKPDWARLYPGAKRVPLPTYPFQRERYWLSSASGPTDAGSIGLRGIEHPLLAAAIEDPSGERLTLTGRISLSTHPWLADHAVLGTVILPGTAFVEMALKAAGEAGCEAIDELTLQAPLVLPEQGAVSLQVTVAEAGEQGSRPITIHSRTETGEEEAGEWVLHASGTLSPEAPEAPEPLGAWPPEGAEQIETDDLYERLAGIGFDYGPAFQGLSAAWRDGEQIYAEVELAGEQREQAGRFAIHPALFDSALHGALLAALEAGEQGTPMPFSWSEVVVGALGATSARVRLSAHGEEISLDLYDAEGTWLARAGSLRMRPVSPEQLQSSPKQELFELAWQQTTLPDPSAANTGETPEATLLDTRDWTEDTDPVAASHATAARALEQIQAHLAKDEDQQSRLVLLTEGALSTAETDAPNLPAATLTGLLRSAQTEHPGRFALIDTDGTEASSEAIEAAIAASLEEPQVALREGEALVPRLAEAKAGTETEDVPTLDPEKTILITGATGGLGVLFARHLAEAHGARHLLLASRSGEKAEGATELQAELEELGAEATIAACDVSDPKALKKLLASIPQEHPLGAVIHAAGVLDDSLIESMEAGQIGRVMAPKANAAHHLHELTKAMELSAFVLFSSVVGTLGGPGQGNYAAANSFLDALAQRRRREGLPAVSIAWGLWPGAGGMTANLSKADLARMERLGIGALTEEQGLALFDRALGTPNPLALALHFNAGALRSLADAGIVPPLLRGLVRARPRRSGLASAALLQHLMGLSASEREKALLEMVLAEVAAVLGYASSAGIDPSRAFKDLGFDSLAAVELRNRLASGAGVSLQSTVVFDYPTSTSLAQHLLGKVSANGVTRKAGVRAQALEEPIAIVGMACRYPGEVFSPEELWRLVAEGRDGISGFPVNRGWELEHLYDPDPEQSGTSYAREGGFLHEAGDFDAEFFGVAPREALAMDPQQRLLLEASWQALEDAGLDPASLGGLEAGVFTGVMHHDYGNGGPPSAEVEGYVAAGAAGSVASGRIAYTLGLEGPAMTVDTACSSSLVTLHLASQSLRAGECSLALAGGATVLATPMVFTEFSRQRGLASDGRSKSFSEAADGVGWAEGVGVLVLERLSDAERQGHPVLAILKGSAVNQDGASNGLTAPNGPSQERVIRQALANARLEPRDIDAVEAHGTGTTLGDPIEAGALLATYGQDREEPLRLGSIKSNIGHTQAAAGVAGVIKMVEAMRHGVLPKTLHVDKPSSKVDWEAGEVELLTEEIPWQPNGKPRRAGISSFGISGTNAHVILEEAPAPKEDGAGEEAATPEAPLSGVIALPLSAKTEPALREAAANLATHLSENPELDPEDIAFSLATTRALFERRGVVTGSDRDELLSGLKALSQAEPAANTFEAKAKSGKLAYLLTGQGAQRATMGKELYEASPAFAKALDEACEAIDPHLGRPLKELLFAKGGSKEAALLDETTFTQPALFAIEAALFRALEQTGMVPDYLTGHSVGEISAAHISGVLSLGDAAKLICTRAKLMGELPAGGAMVAIEATEQEVAEAIEGKEKELSIAAVNGPTAIVISGVGQAALEIQARFEEQGKKTKRLAVSHAFHSPLIEPVLDEFAKVAETLDYQAPQIPIVSNTSGEILTEEQATDPAYWVSHVREAVRFAEGIETLQEQGVTTFVELGPDAVLTAMATSCLPEGSEATLIPTLRKGRGESESLVGALASAHAAGAKPDWARLYPGAKRVPLPTYPFQRERFWLSSTQGPTDAASIGQGALEHPLLAAAIEDPSGERLTLTGRISLSTHPWLADHAVLGTVILPGTAFVELALKAAEEAGCEAVGELTLQAPLMLSEQGAVSLQVSVAEAGEQGVRQISIHSRTGAGEEEAGEWVLHASGTLSPEGPPAPEPLAVWPPEGAEPVGTADLYERLAGIGFDYGPAFQGLTAAWQDGAQIYAEVSLAGEQREEAGRFAVHPALFDSALHGALLHALEGGEEGAGLPFSWSGISVQTAGAQALRASLGTGEDRISLDLYDLQGMPVARAGSLRMRPVSAEQLKSSRKQELFELAWQRTTLPDPSAADTGETPEATLLDTREWAEDTDPVAASHATAARALEQIQAHLAKEEDQQSRLVFLTEGALSTAETDAPNLPAATLTGLLRSAQTEHPGRFALIDTDGTEASSEAIEAAIAASLEEPQVALREGEALVPRLAEAKAGTETEDVPTLDPEKTILITGATGGLGVLFARHLAEAHGARHLLLASRSGEKAEGATELQAELEELGAEATIAACDVSDPKALKKLLASIPQEHPLGAVIHAAGVLDDSLIESMEAGQIGRVMAPKANAAHHLHELTKAMELSAFVLFSSVVGTLGGPGQGNYAAANSFLDALAQRRRREGLPAVSIAWGLWERESTMTAGLGEADLARIRRSGLAPISDKGGLELFDVSIQVTSAQALAVSLDRGALRSQAAAGALPAIFSGLVRGAGSRRKAGSGQLAARLAALPEAEHEAVVLEAVRAEVAAVLGHDSAAAIEPERAFKDLGFDSLAAVELRNRLGATTGISLPATMAFDHPSSAALARYLLAEVGASGAIRKTVTRAQASEEPVAIVGMSCRYPGDASSPEELWQLVAMGRDGISEFPANRGWDLERLYDPEIEGDGSGLTSYTREGGFLHDSADFDAAFFGISPREALATDPQQRLLLEASWQALEDAGIDPKALAQTQTGVFAGVMYQDYGGAAGMTQSVVSGRVAYTLGLEGPAITVDTACSSSLVAMHWAAESLRSGECSLALAGGVTVLSTPGVFTEFSRQRGLAPDGRSKSFSEAADGVGWAEGVGVLVLERLSDAKRNGHEILAVLKGSAVNQDGASNGLTAPNGPSQERVIRQALANARLEPKDIDAVEAHGTGTTLGDPIEAGALLATYGQERDEPLKLGSIKSNIGHTQAAAGVAGVIKMVEAMRHGVLPKTLHVDKPSSKVDWEAGEVELLTEGIAWQPNGKPRRAGVSSFGISGTNAHVILEEAPQSKESEGGEEAATPEPPLSGVIALPLSAKTVPALHEAAANLATHLSENLELDPEDVAFSLATTRALFERRGVITGSDREELLSGLKALSQEEPAPNAFEAKAKSGKLAYLLTGQGAQRAAMGKELYAASPAFAKALDEACEAIDPHLERPLKELLFAKEGSKEAALLDQTTFTQPALFAIEAALFRALEQTGMRPDYLTGHSVGEISAAHISGVLSLEDAAKLICTRAKLMGELPAGGAMVAIEATEQEVAEAIEGKEKELSIAAVNGPNSVVISGKEQAALEVQADFEEQGKKTKRLAVSHAFHSPLIEPVLEEFAKVAETLDYQAPQIPIVSNTSGELLTEEQATDPAYWVSHVREAVRFAEGIETLHAHGVSTFVELGPDAVLTAMAASCLPEGSEATLIPTLRKGRGESESLIGALASAHTAGAKPDWARLYPGAKRVPLPTYPFQRERFWLSSTQGPTDAASIGQGALDHPLLAARVEDPSTERLTLTGRISLSTHPWLADHAVLGTVILPGTAFVELALKAAEEAGCEAIAELTLQAPLLLSEQAAVSLQVTVAEAGEQGSRPITIHSRTDARDEAGEWTLHASGTLSPEAPPAPEPLGAWPPEGAEPVGTSDLYERLAGIGFDYGPAFQGLSAAWRDGEQIYAEVSLAGEQSEEAGRFAVHPALFDSAFHAILDPASSNEEEQPSAPVIPFSWSGIALGASGASSLRVRLTREGERIALLGVDAAGETAIRIESVTGRPLDQDRLATKGRQSSLYRLDWKELNLSEAGESKATLLDTRDWTEDTDPVKASHATAARALELVQAHLAKEEDQQSRLVFLTKGALAAGESEDPNLPAATLAGLLRSAHSEHPGRFALIDTDGSDASNKAIEAAIAASLEEPQIALREGEALVPRLAEAKAGTETEDAPTFDPEKTILVTGATGGLGALFARHLAEAHGARNLLLASRSGEKAAGARELKEELEELGAKATIAACDVSDPKALEELLDSIPKAHPLGAVIHAAGVFDNGLIADLDPERLSAVMAPKADAAHHLHELTRETGLSHFVLFSSAAGLLGGPGQGNYAAANSFLDALAAKRRSQGLPSTSLAWGLWAQESNLAGELSEAEAEQMLRQTRMLLGFAPIPAEQGLELFETSISTGAALLAPVHFDRAALRAQAKTGSLPALMRGLVRAPKGRESSGDALATRLGTVPEAGREAFVLDFVRGHVAAVLGHDSAAEIEPERAFKDMGFDSLAAVELRNRLVAATAERLPATVVFDYPSAAALAGHLLERVAPAEGNFAKLDPHEREVRQAIASIPLARLRQSGLMDQLVRLARLDEEVEVDVEDEDDLVDSMDVEELVRRGAEGLSLDSQESVR